MRAGALVAAAVAAVASATSVTAIVAPAAATTHPCTNANRSAASASAATMRAALLCLVNRERASHHLPALRANALLNRSAQQWTDRMVATGVFSHGSDFGGRISAVGYRWTQAGENIATGYPTPRQVMIGWMASTGHCRNILDPNYRDLGIGVSRRPVGRWADGPATWTQDFGLRAGQPPPSRNWGPAGGCPY